MFRVHAAIIATLLVSGTALAQGPAGDAVFCRQYADTVATASEDAIERNPACLSPSEGVHGDRRNHTDWCLRTPRGEVEGASLHIRRLATKCTRDFLPAPEEYGGYAIVRGAPFERPYGQARGWDVRAAFAGRLFMYCVASNDRGGRSIRIGVDRAMPGDQSQWQLAVPLRSRQDWQGRLEIDDREPADRAGADVSGTAFADWTIAWLNLGQVDALRQGDRAVLGVGKQDFDFSLAGVAAAISKIEECRARSGDVAPAPGAAAMLEPAGLVETIHREAMAGRDVFEERTRAHFLSRELLRLIVQDEQESARLGEPGKLEYSLLSGGQDRLVIGDLRVTEVSRGQGRATVRVDFRNTAFGNRAPMETVLYRLQAGDQGWRITNIVYDARHDLLSTLTR